MCAKTRTGRIIPSFDATGAAPGPAQLLLGQQASSVKSPRRSASANQGAQVALAFAMARSWISWMALCTSASQALGLGEQTSANIARCAGSSTTSMGLWPGERRAPGGREGARRSNHAGCWARASPPAAAHLIFGSVMARARSRTRSTQ